MKKLILGLVLSVGMSGMAMANNINTTFDLEKAALPRVCYNQAVVDVYDCDDDFTERKYSAECMRDCNEGEATGNVQQTFHEFHFKRETSLCQE